MSNYVALFWRKTGDFNLTMTNNYAFFFSVVLKSLSFPGSLETAFEYFTRTDR